uniref:Transmembrane protein n=1 Tax=Trichobilharzia regenti TaxID=157069 RepID=A0AA85JWY8_TRIRE|nr:unnamed protein product [Trichobilharzia regenti]
MNRLGKTSDLNEFLANITLMVAKTSVAIYLVKQTPSNISCYEFVKFLQHQYKKREQQKEAILNFCLLHKNKQLNQNSYDNEITIDKITEISNYMIYNSSRLKLIKFNLQNALILTNNQVVHQIKYSLHEILASSVNILIHAFKKSSKKGIICVKKMNYFIDLKEDVQTIFHLWVNKTMEHLKENSNNFIQCFTILKYFMIPDIVHSEADNNLWYSTTLELALILSSILSAHLNTKYQSGIVQFITGFINDALKIFNEIIKTLILQRGKVLLLRTSGCAQLVWILINLLKYFDCEIFNKTQTLKWIQILDKLFEIQQSSIGWMMKAPTVQLTGLMFITLY